MILRRVIGHFRQQEWAAIAIDFVIVVVGVFVGIQVDLTDNINRFGAYAVDVLAEQRRLQQALHAQLDRRLDIRHESTSPPGAIK